jgi:hypothetical protein
VEDFNMAGMYDWGRDFFGQEQQQQRQGISGNINMLYDQMNPQYYSLPQAMNNFLLGGYMNYGNQMQNAMSQMAAVNHGNQMASVMNRANYDAPVAVEQIRADAQKDISGNRLSTLSPILQALAGSLGSTAFGSPQMGFSAVGADGKPFASATQGGSNAQPTNTSAFKPGQRAARPAPKTRYEPRFGGMNVSTGR